MSITDTLKVLLADIEALPEEARAEYDALKAEASSILAKVETTVEKIEEVVENAVEGIEEAVGLKGAPATEPPAEEPASDTTQG